jgi:hypothetical protein
MGQPVMMDRNMKLAVFLSMIILLYVSVTLTMIILILGLLFIPPVAVIAYTSLHGIQILRREMEAVLSSGKDFLLISVSKKYITLEPQFSK